MTQRLHFHFSLSFTGEGNGNPLQYSCLENPRDGGAWWAAIYGVAQSRTRLKRLSSSSGSSMLLPKIYVNVEQIYNTAVFMESQNADSTTMLYISVIYSVTLSQ